MDEQELEKKIEKVLRVLLPIIIFGGFLCYQNCSSDNDSSSTSSTSYSSYVMPKAGITLKFDSEGTVYLLNFEEDGTGSFSSSDGVKSRFSWHKYGGHTSINFSQSPYIFFNGYAGSCSDLYIKDEYIYRDFSHANAKDTELGIKLYR